MALEKNLQKMEMRQQYRNLWHTELTETPGEDPIYCCFACLWFYQRYVKNGPEHARGLRSRFSPWHTGDIDVVVPHCLEDHEMYCIKDYDNPPSQGSFKRVRPMCFKSGPCASYMLRKRALYDDMSRYVCCAGYMPCSGRCGESQCPEICLCTEVLCCFSNSVASTRYLLQDEFNIQTSQCDNCIIGFMVCLQQLACICSIIAAIAGTSEISDTSQLLSCVSEIVMCAVCPCMQTQHKIEMDKRDGKFGARSMMEVPPVQQMSRLDQPIPAEAGYPPPPAYGQPLSYPPPSQAEGYPPPSQAQTYPPANYPPPSQAQTYPPANYPPPSQAQTYPPANYPPPGTGYPPPNYQN